MDFNKFIVLHKAVGEKEGVIRFTDLGGASTQNKVVDEHTGHSEKVVEVEMTTIDKEVAHYNLTPSFIKTDVEGQDLNALKGALNTLKSGSVRIVKFEHIGDNPLQPILQFFDQLKWRVFSLDNMGKPTLEESRMSGELNLFAMPEQAFKERFEK